MIEIFTHSTVNRDIGSAAYTSAVIGTYRQYAQSGLVDILLDQGDQIEVLLADGKLAAVYYLTATDCIVLSELDLEKLWTGGEALVRQVNLPTDAVRMAGEVFEWYPPKQTLVMQSSALQSALHAFGTRKDSGLLHLLWPESEGLLTLIDGQNVQSEACFIYQDRFQTGSIAVRQILGQESGDCQLAYYEAKEATSSFQRLILRYVVADIMRHILGRYRQMVGHSLLIALNNEVNRVMQMNNLHIHLEADVIENLHVFRSVEESRRSYELLFKVVSAHISSVIGSALSLSLMREALESLDPRSQRLINEQIVFYPLVDK